MRTESDVAVYVPASGSFVEHAMKRGSAIVGSPQIGATDRVMIDYEGDVYGSMKGGYMEWLLHAADRHRSRYPTTARMLVEAEEVILVGWYDTVGRTLDILDQAAYDDWTKEA